MSAKDGSIKRNLFIALTIIFSLMIVMNLFGLLPEQDHFPNNARIRIIETGEEAIVRRACRVRRGHPCTATNMAVTADDDYWRLTLTGDHNLNTDNSSVIYIQLKFYKV